MFSFWCIGACLSLIIYSNTDDVLSSNFKVFDLL